MIVPTRHPVVKLPTDEEIVALVAREGAEFVKKLLADREKVIEDMKRDPLRNGYVPPFWDKLDEYLAANKEMLLLGGNRGGKSEYCARTIVKQLVEKPNQIVACLHSSHDSSIRQQQEYIYRYLPPEWRDLGKIKGDKRTNVTYTEKNGFADNVLILPNGSKCYFFNYKQDVKVLEGYEFDFVWADELVPLDFIEALRFRLLTRSGKLLVSFTPVTGYTQVVASYVAGATVVEEELAPLLPADMVHVKGCSPGHMPRFLKCAKKGRVIGCIFAIDNPFSPYEEMVSEVEGSPLWRIKMRGYGWAEKPMDSDFSRFDENVHVIPEERWEEIRAGGGSFYVGCDPAGAKPWFIKWYFVTPEDHVIVYREWPDEATYGDWAKPSDKAAFDGGEAQKSAKKLSINEYKEFIWELENNVWDDERGCWDRSKSENVLRRVMDPRMGGMEVPSAEKGVSIISLLADDEFDYAGRLKYESMLWEAAPASGVAETVQMINSRMAWNDEQPLSPMNCPSWYVVEHCTQSIYAYKEFTEAAGLKCALKDIIDPDRYFVKSDCVYLEDEDLECYGGGHY